MTAACAGAALVVAVIAFLSKLTGGRELTDDWAGIHFLATHPFALLQHNRALLDELAGGFAAYPPLQAPLMALALAPFSFLPTFWSHRLATALVLLACTYQGWALAQGQVEDDTNHSWADRHVRPRASDVRQCCLGSAR